jgi:hypothetical protein
MHRGESLSLRESLNVHHGQAELVLLLTFTVFSDNAPPDFCAKLSLHDADITIRGRSIRKLRPVYLKQQQASIKTHCSLPSVPQLSLTLSRCAQSREHVD